jgi:signal peptidase II
VKGRDHHWPTFNVADIAICVGVGLMAIDMFTSKRPRSFGASLPPSAGMAAPALPPTDAPTGASPPMGGGPSPSPFVPASAGAEDKP